jgi:hypothetical protein
MPRLRLAQHAHGLQQVRLTVRPVRSTNLLAIVLCNLYRSRSANGTLSGWTLSSSYLRLPASPLSWWLLTACPRKVFSFRLRTLSLPRTLQMRSFPMCPQSMASLSMCHPTADRNSLLTSSAHSAPSFACAYTSRQVTTPQPTVR